MSNRTLWIVQGLLAAVFLFAGVAKLVMPVDEMTKGTSMTGSFLHFISVCEILGAIGLILPGLLKTLPGLTPLAAVGLVIIMIGAVVTTLQTGSVVTALLPMVVGILCVFVAYGRWRRV